MNENSHKSVDIEKKFYSTKNNKTGLALLGLVVKLKISYLITIFNEMLKILFFFTLETMMVKSHLSLCFTISFWYNVLWYNLLRVAYVTKNLHVIVSLLNRR